MRQTHWTTECGMWSAEYGLRIARRGRGLALLIGILAIAATAARAVDIPTWQPGDRWDAARSFNLDFGTTDPLDLAVSLGTQETYELTVAEVADLATSDAGVVKVYRRTRSNGRVSGSGTANLGGIPLNLRWSGGSTAGEDWTAVGDLASVREHFTLTGSVQAQVLLWLEVAALTLDATLDFRPPREIADFPIETVGEAWETTVSQALRGRIRVQWNENFPLWPGGSPPDDLDEVFDVSVSQNLAFQYVGREAHGGFPDTYRIDAGSALSLWYEPSLEEFVEMILGDFDFGGGSALTDFIIQITDANLAADPNLTIASIDPQPAPYGSTVTLIGTTDPNVLVEASFPGQGSAAQTRADTGGGFALRLRCPDHDDATPSTDDAGSFGVEVLAETVGRKVVTVQLAPPPTGAGRWHLYK